MDDLVTGADGLVRCPWGAGTADYIEYHDTEWGRPVRGDTALFERLTLEAFQSGLSWLTILRKREAFRAAFAGFDPQAVAAFGPADEERLMLDAGIVRNRAKITSTIANARALVAMRDAEGDGALDALLWSSAPTDASLRRQGLPRPPRRMADVPAHTQESAALARELKARGWRFLGPVTLQAAMAATGIVDDHLVGCHRRAAPGA